MGVSCPLATMSVVSTLENKMYLEVMDPLMRDPGGHSTATGQ